ncbi:MAG: hypothetical protein M3542_09395, partial [Acidobacteriota bacterium]|nr:hypothetical protein [Acidobacteriota bacterium]MDQ5871593.1 hypothetical protein [Acidobacteriota bacterium]
HWEISESAVGSWRPLNRRLSDNVSTLFIADLNHNNVDDLLRLHFKGASSTSVRLEWWVSDDGTSDWRFLKGYDFPITFGQSRSLFGLAGRFGTAPGGGVLTPDFSRIGHFYSSAESAVGALPNWDSLFAY